MLTIFLVLGFSFLVIIFLFIFGLLKLECLSKERVCVCINTDENDRATILCDRFNELLINFRERRNEFLNCFGQFIITIVVVTLLVILLLLDKISSEAALPIIAGLGSFGLGKGISTIKTITTTPEKLSPDKNTTKD